MPPLQFQQLSSQPTPSFWTALNSLKLDRLKLDDTQQPMSAWLSEGKEVVDRESAGGEKKVGVAGTVGVGGSAFGEDSERSVYFRVYDTPRPSRAKTADLHQIPLL